MQVEIESTHILYNLYFNHLPTTKQIQNTKLPLNSLSLSLSLSHVKG